MSQHYEALKAKVDEIEEDVQKFYDKGNNAAGTRIRKAMQEVKALAQGIRKEVQERKNQ
ncbi:MAG: histone H1 [Bacteroidetes bacterium]|nr:histone H1 [Bacteroidota bacterium]